MQRLGRLGRKWVQRFPMSGELLNDEAALVNHPLAPFDSAKQYEVVVDYNGARVVGEWNWDTLADRIVAELPDAGG